MTIGNASNLALPPDFGSLFGWWNFNSASTLTLSGSLISQIKDMNNNGNNFSGTTTTRPVITLGGFNGRTVAQFNSTNSTQLTGSTADPFGATGMTVFIFMMCPATNNQCYIGKLSSPNGSFYLMRDSSANNARFLCQNSASATSGINISNVTDGAYNILTARYSNANNQLSLFRNGVLGNTSSLTAPLKSDASVALTLGARPGSTFFSGQIGEVIIYNQYLNDNAVRDIVNYIRIYWGYSTK